MILSSLLLIIPKVKKWSFKSFLCFFTGLVFGLFISFSDPLIENENLIFIFFCGIISISGMTLPGLSGSFLLLILGNYNLLLVDSVNVLFYSIINILKLNFDFLNINENIEMLKILFVFVIGCVFGIIAFSKLLGHLLRNFYNNTMVLDYRFCFRTIPVIWLWKKIIFLTDNNGNPLINEIGKNEIKNYLYFLPEFNSFFQSLQFIIYFNWFYYYSNIRILWKKKIKVYGLVGRDIDYSFSKDYFNEKFKRDKIINSCYKNFDLKEINQFKNLIEQNDIIGLNVTIPYKKSIIKFLDKIDETAKKINAVNTLIFDKKKGIVGYNTDYYGFKKSLIETLKKPENAFILGSGGASSAVEYVLNEIKIPYKVVSRNPVSNQIHYKELSKNLIKNHTLIINTTPLGTYPNISKYPNIPYTLLNKTNYLFDLIYNPSTTKFLELGLKKRSKNSKWLQNANLSS